MNENVEEDAAVIRDLIDGLCDEAWEGRWEIVGILNTRPMAAVTAPAVMRALTSKGYVVRRARPEGEQMSDQPAERGTR